MGGWVGGGGRGGQGGIAIDARPAQQGVLAMSPTRARWRAAAGVGEGMEIQFTRGPCCSEASGLGQSMDLCEEAEGGRETGRWGWQCRHNPRWRLWRRTRRRRN